MTNLLGETWQIYKFIKWQFDGVLKCQVAYLRVYKVANLQNYAAKL